MASIVGNGSTETTFKAGNVLPNTVNTAGGFNPSLYVSKGGKKSRQQHGGALAFSELKGGKKTSRKTSKKTSRKTSKKRSKNSAKRGKKTIKNALKGLFGLFKKK
jgi:hypothetical protein